MAAVTPLNLKATPGNAQVVLRWDAVGTATKYHVKRSSGNASHTLIATVAAPTATYADHDVTNGTTYQYVVTAEDGTGESAPTSDVSATPAATSWLKIDFDAGTIGGMVVLIVIIAILYSVTKGDSDLLRRLQEQAYARGIITFTVIFGTVAIAFVLVFSALFGVLSTDERFRRAREVFGVLAGVLGTIVGFYFGAADKDVKRLTLAPLHFTGTGLRTVAVGGTPPYRYSIAVDKKERVSQKQSIDGWIVEDALEFGEKDDVTVTVKDKNDQEAALSAAVPSKIPAPTKTPPATSAEAPPRAETARPPVTPK